MKRLIGLWIFWLLGMIVNVFTGVEYYFLFYMLTQRNFFFWVIFLVIAALYFPLLIFSSIGLFRLKRWGRNIFVTITVIMTSLEIVFLTASFVTSKLSTFFIRDITLTLFFVSFLLFFVNSATKELFNRKH